jgi:hypothetical protein
MFNKFSQKSRCLWDKVEKYFRARQATDSNMIRRMRCASWIIKAINTHSEYEIQQWLQEHISILR